MLVQLVLSGITSFLEGNFYDDLKPGYDHEDVIIHCRTVSLPLALAQAVVGSILIYLVLLNYQIFKKVTQKDDPFNAAHLLSMLILFVILQRVIFRWAFYHVFTSHDLKDTTNPRHIFDEVITARYATMSMEFLFMVIPFRHNFALNKVEV